MQVVEITKAAFKATLRAVGGPIAIQHILMNVSLYEYTVQFCFFQLLPDKLLINFVRQLHHTTVSSVLDPVNEGCS